MSSKDTMPEIRYVTLISGAAITFGSLFQSNSQMDALYVLICTIGLFVSYEIGRRLRSFEWYIIYPITTGVLLLQIFMGFYLLGGSLPARFSTLAEMTITGGIIVSGTIVIGLVFALIFWGILLVGLYTNEEVDIDVLDEIEKEKKQKRKPKLIVGDDGEAYYEVDKPLKQKRS